MQTNLLGKSVCIDDCGTIAEICCVYTNDRGKLMIAAMEKKRGVITTHLARRVQVIINQNFYVKIYYTPEQKIRVIKTVRELTQTGLQDAKNLVEGYPGEVKVLTDLTIQDAERAVKIIKENKLEGTIGQD
jgi:ribosomal protein L7/L12